MYIILYVYICIIFTYQFHNHALFNEILVFKTKRLKLIFDMQANYNILIISYNI